MVRIGRADVGVLEQRDLGLRDNVDADLPLQQDSLNLTEHSGIRSPVSPPESPITPEQAALLQKVGRGFQVRNSFMNPDNLEAGMKKALSDIGLEGANSAGFRKSISGEILSSTNPAYQKYGVRQTYTDPSLSEPIQYWVSRKGNEVKIEILGRELGKGVSKKALASHEITVDLKKKAITSGVSTATIVFKPEDTASILKGSNLVREHLLEHSPEAMKYFALDLTNTDRIASFNSDNSMTPVETTEFIVSSSYGGDYFANSELSKVVEQTPVIEAKDVRRAGDLKSLKNPDKQRKALANTANGLLGLHRSGVVHSDIKPANIFFDANAAKFDSRIADLDSACLIGAKAAGLTPRFADYLTKQGDITTPFTDIFALATMMQDLKTPVPENITQLQREVLKLGEGEEVLNWLNREGQEAKKLLQSSDEGKRREGFAQLDKQFPQFNQFLAEVANLP